MEALQGTARKLWDFAKLHGLRDDWHEPDEQDIDVIVRGSLFDNAHGDPEMGAEWSDDDYAERFINIFKKNSANNPKHDIYLNLATLCALATIGAGVVLGETKPFPGLVNEQGQTIAPPTPDSMPRFSLNELNAILATVLKTIGGDQTSP